MKQLKHILQGVDTVTIKGSTAIPVADLCFDSRKAETHTAFFALTGLHTDGHNYIPSAIEKGAQTIVCERIPQSLAGDTTYIQVENSKKALALMAANYYGKPSEDLKLTGVTGTNGKTTVASLLYKLFTKAGYITGLISTVTIKVGEENFETILTTPDSITINSYLKKMVDAGVEYCFMEVSSHGIAQKRTAGLQFSGGIFTNLSHEHLDYHKNFAEYRDVKKQLFDGLPKTAFALTNIDDKNGAFMLQNTAARKNTYALKSTAGYKAKIIEAGFRGLLLNINGHEVWSQLIGKFNAYNLLAIYAAADLLGIKKMDNLKYISELEAVEGRFEYFISPKKHITAIVDFAHSPDALKNVLQTINNIRANHNTLITVVGCGGDRDTEKRPTMAGLATGLSTKVILTSDNPRTEDPDKIINDMEKGVKTENLEKTLSITDRRQAIKTACSMAGENEIILIAGKGHETYQEINGKRHHFDDMEFIREFLDQMQK